MNESLIDFYPLVPSAVGTVCSTVAHLRSFSLTDANVPRRNLAAFRFQLAGEPRSFRVASAGQANWVGFGDTLRVSCIISIISLIFNEFLKASFALPRNDIWFQMPCWEPIRKPNQ